MKFLLIWSFIFFTVAAQADSNLYQVLGIPPNATHAEIKTAWKTLVRKFHPDRHMNDPQAAKEASDKLAVINAAESVLGDPKLRAYYNYFSLNGANHARWASISGNSNAETMEKRFGPVEKLKPQETSMAEPQQRRSARPTPPPPPRTQKSESPPTQKPTPERPDPRQDTIFAALKNKDLSDEKWKEAYHKYITQMPMEKDYERQLILVELLFAERTAWKFEALARAVILKYDTSGNPSQIALKNFLKTENPEMLKMGVALLHYALVKGRTLDLFQMSRADAEAHLISKLKSPFPEVRDRSQAAIDKLNIPLHEKFSATYWIQHLENHDAQVRREALDALNSFSDFSEAELKELSYQLLKRNAQNTQYEHTEYWLRNLMHLGLEMGDLLSVLSKARDLSPIVEELAEFRRTTTIPDHKGRAKELELRARTQAHSCRQVFAI